LRQGKAATRSSTAAVPDTRQSKEMIGGEAAMMAQPGAKIAAMRPETDDEALDRLLHPERHYDRPQDVLADPALTRPEQRAILSSWAPDACAVTGDPTLRRLPRSGRPVTFDEIMDALTQLDRAGAGGRGAAPRQPADDPRGAGL
jgi:hypothetical protein